MSTDSELDVAAEVARKTFRYFWRELTWEYRRIVPALDMAAVKFPFSDPGNPATEFMWVTDVMFDGKVITGTLLNSPHALKTFREGQRVERPLGELYDWIYASMGKAHGALSVQVLRRRMEEDEREAHDDAWGLDFGDPKKPLVPDPDAPETEHPMALNMAPELVKELESGRIKPNEAGEDGWTMMHSLALGGATACVEALLAAGADPNVKTPHGLTAQELAASLGWTQVAELLRKRTAS